MDTKRIQALEDGRCKHDLKSAEILMSQELIGELKKQGQRLDILGRDIRAGFAITLGAVLLGGFLAYAGIIQTERIQHTANAYSDYLTAIVDGDCKKSGTQRPESPHTVVATQLLQSPRSTSAILAAVKRVNVF